MQTFTRGGTAANPSATLECRSTKQRAGIRARSRLKIEIVAPAVGVRQQLGRHHAQRCQRAIVACRTPALGGQRFACERCGEASWRWHSCRNRHCPQCQHREREAWRVARLAELLDVPYCHVVFTLPHELNALAAMHPRWVYETLMRSASQTLSTFAADRRWLGGIGAYTLVLHTWTQDLRRHLHVHALVACGALDIEHGAAQWVSPRRGPRFLFPVHALSRVFRGIFLEHLRDAETAGVLRHDPCSPQQRCERRRALLRHDWVVYAKTPLAGPAQVLDYLARYTHRTAIGNERLLGIVGDRVRLRVRDHRGGDDDGGRGGKRTIEIGGIDFIGRLLQHVLPVGFKRASGTTGCSHPAGKAQRLALARELLAMPAADERTREAVREFMQRVAGLDIERCPHCGGHWIVVERIAPLRHGWLQRPDVWTPCRGPP